MNIGKYDRAAGSGTKATKGTTAASGGTATVDLTPITDKVAALESKVSTLELQLAKVNSVLSGLDGKFLSKFGDSSDYSYALGALYTDFISSGMYDNGVGFRISGNATAEVDDKYNLIVKDVGWSYAPWTTIQQNSATLVDSNTDESSAQLTASDISVGAAASSGYLLLDCGATLTNERCFTTISKTLEYKVQITRGNQIYVGQWTEAETDSNGNFILYFSYGDDVSISLKFIYKYAFRQVGDITSGTYRLYIRGTDPSNSQTDCFAAATKVTTLNASGVTIMNGQNGARITSSGVQTTTDGGTTWI